MLLFAVYWTSLDGAWQFDDIPNIRDNPRLHLRSLSWQGIRQALFSDQKTPGVPYRPVACLSFALNHYFGGLEVFGYHLVNVSIHGVSAVFLLFFLFYTLNLPSLRDQYGSNSFGIALLAALLWAVHPIQTQGVSYIVQRMTSLAGMFTILSLYVYVRARTESKKRKRGWLLALCSFSFLMALGSKENAIMLPFSIALYEVLIVQEDPKSFLKENIKGVLLFIGFGTLLAMAFLYYRSGNVLSVFLDGYEGRPFTMPQRLLTEPRVMVFYLSLLLYPLPQRFSIAHSIEISNSLFEPLSTLFSAVFILASIAFLIIKSSEYRVFSFCYLFYFLNHIPESTILPLELVFEHRNYIPSMMFFLPLSVGVFHLLRSPALRRGARSIIYGLIVLVLMALAHATGVRNLAWESRATLWLDALEKAPNQLRVHHNLGVYYQERGWPEKAIAEYKRALRSPEIHRKNERLPTLYQLGRVYADIGAQGKAEFYYREAIALKPDFCQALLNLAALYDQAGNKEKSDRYLAKAYKVSPASAQVNFNMGLRYLREGRPDRAIPHLLLAKRHEQLSSRTLLFLGVAYKQQGRFKQAVSSLRRSAESNKRDVTPRLHLLEIFERTEMPAEARKEAEWIARKMNENNAVFFRITELLQDPMKAKEAHLSPGLVLPTINRALKEK